MLYWGHGMGSPLRQIYHNLQQGIFCHRKADMSFLRYY
ncbi:hypothetical protein CLOBOL_04065 [Enterocloster bolteae ATCC BAA-613]|uniref:Uncharacterized protein n=1 Tax=Enterocloster bolteae (strain ATCC BAA-613 / DSM 15670 / CCUG 46953 / JCM 12243 / WAL 16351) TaxID=411902 RepID=A8RUM7_ENTBW|nr:hypothetical protein CLOBOL_04065 [Enterocloster bolteae ATCC BAA-613]